MLDIVDLVSHRYALNPEHVMEWYWDEFLDWADKAALAEAVRSWEHRHLVAAIVAAGSQDATALKELGPHPRYSA